MGSGSISSTTEEEVSGNPTLDGWHSLNPRGSRQSGSRTACSLSLPPQVEGRELLQSGPRRQVIIPPFLVKSWESSFPPDRLRPSGCPSEFPPSITALRRALPMHPK